MEKEFVEKGFIPLAPLIATLGVVLMLSLIVERFMMVLSWLIERLFIIRSSLEWDGVEKKKADLSLAERAKEEDDFLNDATGSATTVASDPSEIATNPNPQYTANPDSRFDVKLFTLPNPVKVLKEFWIQILGGLVAVVGCFYSKLSIWVLVSWLQRWTAGEQNPLEVESAWWEFIVTGIIIGAGSKPIHFLIQFLVNRKIVVTKEEVKEPAAQPEVAALPLSAAAPVVSPVPAVKSIEEIVGFVYDGGDRPQRLENTHKRTEPLDLVVYHHTAMHSDSPFEEVIKEFDRKGWLTGYHCVILKDGTIRILCRWDRIGNHAYGFNSHSLGMALHGNFESDPKVPFANVDGRLGILHPTPAQLDAAARIVALWTFLYGVKPDFMKSILPHYQLTPKACPGSNFPHENFHERIKSYVETWKEDDSFDTTLKKFKSTPMVMV